MPAMKLNGLRHRRADRAHGGQVGQARRHEHVGAGLLEGLQALDHVVEIGLAAEEALGPRGERERKRQRARRLRGGRHALDGLRRCRRAACPCRRWRPRWSRRPARPRRRGGSSPPPPPARRRSPSPDRRRRAGPSPPRSRAPAPSASSRVTLPSRRPRMPAEAPLDVASAWKPSPARMRAEPASHGLGITKAPVPGAARGSGWPCRSDSMP